jgi:hypothetical protein
LREDSLDFMPGMMLSGGPAAFEIRSFVDLVVERATKGKIVSEQCIEGLTISRVKGGEKLSDQIGCFHKDR